MIRCLWSGIIRYENMSDMPVIYSLFVIKPSQNDLLKKVQEFMKKEGKDKYMHKSLLRNEFGQQRMQLTFLEKYGTITTAETITVSSLQK